MSIQKIGFKFLISFTIILFVTLTSATFAATSSQQSYGTVQGPPTLDEEGASPGPAGPNNRLFGVVLGTPITDPSWSLISSIAGGISIYNDPLGRTWIYDARTGSIGLSRGNTVVEYPVGYDVYDSEGRLIERVVPIYDTYYYGDLYGWEKWTYTYDANGRLIGYVKDIYGLDLTGVPSSRYVYSNLLYDSDGKLQSYRMDIQYRDQAGNYNTTQYYEYSGLSYYTGGSQYDGQLSGYTVDMYQVSGLKYNTLLYRDLTYITSGINEGKLASCVVEYQRPSDAQPNTIETNIYTYKDDGRLDTKNTTLEYTYDGSRYITNETYDLTGRVEKRESAYYDANNNYSWGCEEEYAFNYQRFGYEDAKTTNIVYKYNDGAGNETSRTTYNFDWNANGAQASQSYSYEYPPGKETDYSEYAYTYYSDGTTQQKNDGFSVSYAWDDGTRTPVYISTYEYSSREDGNWIDSKNTQYYTDGFDFDNRTGSTQWEWLYTAYYDANDRYSGYDYWYTEYDIDGNVTDTRSGSYRW